MEQAWQVPAMIAVEAVLMVLFGKIRQPGVFRAFAVINMVLITIFGGVMIEIGQIATNIGCIFYASVMAAQSVIYFRAGASEAAKSVKVTLLAIVMILAATTIMDSMEWHGVSAGAYHTVLRGSYELAVASVAAFAISQGVLIAVLKSSKAGSLLGNYIVAVALAQALDSAIFFPLAFGALNGVLVSVMLWGYALKISIGLLLAPLVLYLADRDG